MDGREKRSSSGEAAHKAVSRHSLSDSSPQHVDKAGLKLSHPTLLRAIQSSHLVNQGHLLQSAAGSSADYELSFSCASIQAFVSHSWRADPYNKRMSLWLYFYQWRVSIAALAIFGLSLLCTALVSPTQPADWRPGTHLLTGWASMWMPIVVVALLVIVPRTRAAATTCFLDKSCIPQDNPALKLAAIRQLGGIVASSSTFVCCIDESYMRRLWCCFELAVCIRLDPSLRRLRSLPIAWAPSIYLFFFASFAFMAVRVQRVTVGSAPTVICTPGHVPALMVEALVRSATHEAAGVGTSLLIHSALWCGTLLPGCLIMAWRLVDSFWQLESLRSQLANFSLAALECSVEADRAPIERAIDEWLSALCFL